MNDITNELRDWVSNHYSGWPSKQAEGFTIADSIEAEYKRMQAENAKLRELLVDMFRDFVHCDMALREHGRTYLAYTRYIDRMCELGIEVET